MWSLSFVWHIIFLRAMRQTLYTAAPCLAHCTVSHTLHPSSRVRFDLSRLFVLRFVCALAHMNWECASFEWNRHLETVICNSFRSARVRVCFIHLFGQYIGQYCGSLEHHHHHHHHPQSGQFYLHPIYTNPRSSSRLFSFPLNAIVRSLAHSFRLAFSILLVGMSSTSCTFFTLIARTNISI